MLCVGLEELDGAGQLLQVFVIGFENRAICHRKAWAMPSFGPGFMMTGTNMFFIAGQLFQFKGWIMRGEKEYEQMLEMEAVEEFKMLRT